MDVEKFKIWLAQRGCEILPPTNQYEILRFKGKETGCCITLDEQMAGSRMKRLGHSGQVESGMERQ